MQILLHFFMGNLWTGILTKYYVRFLIRQLNSNRCNDSSYCIRKNVLWSLNIVKYDRLNTFTIKTFSDAFSCSQLHH